MKTLGTIGLLGLLVTSALAGSVDNQRNPLPTELVRFAFISDPHIFGARLGTTGSAFDAYLDHDPKLLKESEAILDSALASIIEQGVKFVIISGDLTKDGEILNHVLMAQHLAKLEQHGIQAFVVPGNHDINNPDAAIFLGDATRPVPSTSPATFRAIYQRFGYGQASARDAHSLSYAAEPVPGLLLLAIDSCKYQDNLALGTPVIGGRISPETMEWIVAQLAEAHAAGKQVIAFMHHGVNQHFLPEPVIFPEYLVDDWPVVSAQLAAAGLKVVFTGHYHQQDAAYPLSAEGIPQATLCDVETASLTAFPCAYRVVTVNGPMLDIRSQLVTQIDADTGGLPFQEFAEASLRARLPGQVIQQLVAMFGVSREEAAAVAPLVVDALVANYVGDEAPSATTLQTISALMGSPEPYHTLGLLLAGFWTDLPPGDNDLSVPFQ